MNIWLNKNEEDNKKEVQLKKKAKKEGVSATVQIKMKKLLEKLHTTDLRTILLLCSER